MVVRCSLCGVCLLVVVGCSFFAVCRLSCVVCVLFGVCWSCAGWCVGCCELFVVSCLLLLLAVGCLWCV